ncbi:MAG: carbohydrate ABC transporter permease, partial [Sciscionella sp.]
GEFRMTRHRRNHGSNVSVLKYLIGVLIVLWSALPLYWGVVLSLSTPEEISKVPVSFVPRSVSGENYLRLINGSTEVSTTFLRALASSAIEALAVTALTLLVGLPAAYGFVRLRSRPAAIAFMAVIFTLAVPVYFVLIPLFQLAASLHQVNTYQAVVLILCSAAMPLAVWIMRSHIASIPVDIEDAARLDGAGTMTLLRKIIAPLVAPGCVAAGTVTFLAAWSAFLIPVVFSNTPATQPLTVLIPQYTSKYAQDYGLQAAAAILALLPPAALVIWLRKYLLSGILAGAVK